MMKTIAFRLCLLLHWKRIFSSWKQTLEWNQVSGIFCKFNKYTWNPVKEFVFINMAVYMICTLEGWLLSRFIHVFTHVRLNKAMFYGLF